MKTAEQDETRQPSPAALFSGCPVGSDALWGSALAPAGDGACSVTFDKIDTIQPFTTGA
jgi:hypothetical protein